MVRAVLLSMLSAFALPQLLLGDKITVKEGIVADEQFRETEPEVNLFQPLSQLNRVTFGKNVFEPSNNGVERWVVQFCLSWYEPCESLDRPFAAVGAEWQEHLNTELFSTKVRFATVDCATDRVLCNEQMVYEYPKIVLYHKHSAVSAWSGGGGHTELVSGMRQWMGQQLGVLVVGSETKIPDSNDFRLDIFVIILAMLGNAWIVTCNPDPEFNPATKTSCIAPDWRRPAEFIAASVSRLLPEHWVGERRGSDL